MVRNVCRSDHTRFLYHSHRERLGRWPGYEAMLLHTDSFYVVTKNLLNLGLIREFPTLACTSITNLEREKLRTMGSSAPVRRDVGRRRTPKFL